MKSRLVYALVTLFACGDAWLTKTTTTSPQLHETRRMAAFMSGEYSKSSSTSSSATTTATTTVSSSLPLQAAFQNTSSPILLYDGVCHFCHAGVHFCLDHSSDTSMRFCSLQSETGKALLTRSGRQADDYSSMVLCYPNGVAYVESEAVLRVAGLLDELPILVRWTATLLRVLLPSVLRDPLYHFVSEHRHEFMGTDDGPSCRIDVDESRFVWDPEEEAVES
jgi:predicted DCC family thiol-disulfide oxidoreductase YuxK